MKKDNGFTIIELIACLSIIGLLTVVAMIKYSDPGVDTLADSAILKSAIRQTIMRAMSDLSTANWNINVAGKVAAVKKDATVVASYDLKAYAGSFSISFNQFGQRQSNPALPYSITIDSETGYVP